MTIINISIEDTIDKHVYIAVWLFGKGWTPAGVVTFNEMAGYSGFSYFDSYIKADHPPLNPATLNHRDSKSRHFVVDPRINSQMLDRTFWELLPTNGDFGHQTLVSRIPNYQGMNSAHKLFFLGTRMVGGLSSYVKKMHDEASIEGEDWLESVRREAVGFHMKEISRLRQSAEGIMAMTSYGGVRPKAMFKDSGGRYWIAKFNLPTDPYDMAVAEHVSMRMAKDSGLVVPDTQILQLPSGENVFLTERFDRHGKERLHSLSLYALAPGIELASHGRNPGGPRANTSGVMGAILRRYSDFKDQDTVRLITKFLVDVGFNNTDNHLRNTRMVLNRQGLWELSPTFDVLFNPRSQPHIYNPAGLDLSQTFLENDSMVEALAEQMKSDPDLVASLRDRVVSVVNRWEEYCDAAGMSSDDKAKIQAAVGLGLSRSEIEHKIQADHRRKIESALALNLKKPKPM